VKLGQGRLPAGGGGPGASGCLLRAENLAAGVEMNWEKVSCGK
jgi:hypothetical protein